jgi:hypothetical protein
MVNLYKSGKAMGYLRDIGVDGTTTKIAPLVVNSNV